MPSFPSVCASAMQASPWRQRAPALSSNSSVVWLRYAHIQSEATQDVPNPRPNGRTQGRAQAHTS
eukprot:8573435-Karenia_brevis.AAC.1